MSPKHFWLFALAACSLPLGNAWAQAPMIDNFVLPVQVDAKQLGYGFDLYTVLPKSGTCLVNAVPTSNSNTSPGGEDSSFHLVFDSEQVDKAMSGSVSANYSSGFTSASGSAAFF